jgi:hypothetical protein
MAYGTSSGNYFRYTRNYNVPAFTASIWAYPNSVASEQTLCGLWEDAGLTYQWLLAINNSSKLLAAAYDGSFRIATATTNMTASVWTHVALVYSSSNILLYENGVQAASSTGGSTLSSRTAATGIGARQAGNGPLSGNLAEFATWTRALSAAEIASLADGFKPSRIPTPDIYYPLVREKIDVRNNYTLTTVGSPTVQPHPRIY